MRINRDIAKLLKRAGATFVRRSKHYIFALPNGRHLTVAGTPSDTHAVNNQAREIKQAGGLVEEKKKNPDRVAKQGRTDAAGRPATREWLGSGEWPAAAVSTAGRGLADQLRSSGLVEASLRKELEALRREFDIKCRVISYQEERIERLWDQIKNWECPCFICRIKRYWNA